MLSPGRRVIRAEPKPPTAREPQQRRVDRLRRASGRRASAFDGALLTWNVEHVLAADPPGIPACRWPRAIGQVCFLELVHRIVGDELERKTIGPSSAMPQTAGCSEKNCNSTSFN